MAKVFLEQTNLTQPYLTCFRPAHLPPISRPLGYFNPLPVNSAKTSSNQVMVLAFRVKSTQPNQNGLTSDLREIWLYNQSNLKACCWALIIRLQI